MPDGTIPRLLLTADAAFTPQFSVPLFIAMIVLIILSGLFSSTETAFTSANRIRLKNMANSGSKRAAAVLHLIDHYDKFISPVLVGNNLVNISATSIAGVFFGKLIANGDTSVVVSTAVMTVAVLIFGEVSPKMLAKIAPEKMALALYPFIWVFYIVLTPVTFLFSLYQKLLEKIFRVKGNDVITEDEIITYVEEAEEDGTLKKEESTLIRSAIEFDDLEVGDILIPRVNVLAIDENAPMEEIRNIFGANGFSRLPVYRESVDTIIGVIHEKDFFHLYLSKQGDLSSIIQPAVYTTEYTKISSLLKNLQSKKIHMAVVLDEYGGTLGIVTLEDILEELVGEIWDEHDEEVNYLKKLDENTYLVDGKANLCDLFEVFDMEEEDENFDAYTVSGWVIEKYGEIPPVGYSYEFNGISVEVVKATAKKVLEVKATRLPPPEEEEKKRLKLFEHMKREDDKKEEEEK